MEKCFGSCFGVLFGRRQTKRLKYLTKYRERNGYAEGGVEFQDLMDEEMNTNSYGSGGCFVTNDEVELVKRGEYNRLVEEQKKIDDQINKKLFEDEEALKREDESYQEAQIEAERAARVTMSLREKSIDLQQNYLPKSTAIDDDLSLDELEDDFEDFISKVRSRSEAFRSQVKVDSTTGTSSSQVLLQRKQLGTGLPSTKNRPRHTDLHAFSDDDDFEFPEDTEFDIGERLEPVGRETKSSTILQTSALSDLDNFGFSDEEMGDFIRG